MKIINKTNLKINLAQCFKWMSDDLYLRMIFYIKNKKHLNLKNPTTFCDKLNWLKINYRIPEWTDYTDKTKVCHTVKKILGKDICFPILGIYDKYDDIDFNKLPDKFVIKNNHDSGSIKIVTDKNKINHKEFKTHFTRGLKLNPFYTAREYAYKNIIPKIVIEKYMVPDGQSSIFDYKFFCFNGKPELLYVSTNHNNNRTVDFYDLDFNPLNVRGSHPMSGNPLTKPETFEEMKDIASKLSENFPFIRIDLYSIDSEVYFGEFTIYHAGGINPLTPESYEETLGKLIKIYPSA